MIFWILGGENCMSFQITWKTDCWRIPYAAYELTGVIQFRKDKFSVFFYSIPNPVPNSSRIYFQFSSRSCENPGIPSPFLCLSVILLSWPSFQQRPVEKCYRILLFQRVFVFATIYLSTSRSESELLQYMFWYFRGRFHASIKVRHVHKAVAKEANWIANEMESFASVFHRMQLYSTHAMHVLYKIW